MNQTSLAKLKATPRHVRLFPSIGHPRPGISNLCSACLPVCLPMRYNAQRQAETSEISRQIQSNSGLGPMNQACTIWTYPLDQLIKAYANVVFAPRSRDIQFTLQQTQETKIKRSCYLQLFLAEATNSKQVQLPA